jgi:ABC-type lipoprotein release transport system permease subunit
MSILQLVFKELWHRRLNGFLSLLALWMAVALLVCYFTTSEASRRETTRVTRDIGFNLRIIPKDTDMDQFWTTGFSDLTMPEESVRRLAEHENVFLAYNHLVASLQRRFSLGGKQVILTGLAPAITAPAQRKQPMGYAIQRGTLLLGHEVTQWLGLKKGSTLELGGRSFTVAQCLSESGTDDDIRVFGLLSDVQQVLGLKGQINEIKAIDCLCLTADQDPLKPLRAELAKVLPEAKVIQLRAIADARAKQRQTFERYASYATPFLLLSCAAWVGLLAVMNVRERKIEIGLLRALGFGSPKIAALFLVKALVLGLLGAALGYALGSFLAVKAGPEIFRVTAKAIRPEASLLWWALLVTPGFTALASFVPTVLAVVQDPAVTLRES